MNISTRLEKLEQASNIDSEFCSCPGATLTRVIVPDIDEAEDAHQTRIAEAQKPEFCNRCGKIISFSVASILLQSRFKSTVLTRMLWF